MESKFVKLIGIVNITEDSFSDGGKYLKSEAAILHALKLIREGADIIELGPSSSHPDSKHVTDEEEIMRISPVIETLKKSQAPLSIDTYLPETQKYCSNLNFHFINDIQGFPNVDIVRLLADGKSKLILMHSVQNHGKATRVFINPSKVIQGIYEFFDQRLDQLIQAGISQDRIILDPGMGFFLGSNPEPSLLVLAEIPNFKKKYGLPMLISVSKKSFLGKITNKEVHDLGAVTLASEIFAYNQGVDFIRTHEVAALKDALKVLQAIEFLDPQENRNRRI